MEIQRYNIFYLIHKSLRALLYETALLLQKTDFDSEESLIALQKTQSALLALENHEQHEFLTILPAVGKYDEQAALMVEADHVAINGKINNIYNNISLFNACHTQALKVKVGKDIQSFFADLTGDCLVHMHREENLINEILWQHLSDKELLIMTGETMKNMSHNEMMFILQHMINGISNKELIQLLCSLKNSLCYDLFNTIIKMSEDSLDPNRWKQVQNQIAEGTAV